MTSDPPPAQPGQVIELEVTEQLHAHRIDGEHVHRKFDAFGQAGGRSGSLMLSLRLAPGREVAGTCTASGESINVAHEAVAALTRPE